jgi:hypothetical protein
MAASAAEQDADPAFDWSALANKDAGQTVDSAHAVLVTSSHTLEHVLDDFGRIIYQFFHKTPLLMTFSLAESLVEGFGQ